MTRRCLNDFAKVRHRHGRMTRAAAVLRMSGVSELSVAAAIRAEKIGLLRRVGRYRRVVLEPYWARVLEQVRAIPEITAERLQALPNAAVAQDLMRLGAFGVGCQSNRGYEPSANPSEGRGTGRDWPRQGFEPFRIPRVPAASGRGRRSGAAMYFQPLRVPRENQRIERLDFPTFRSLTFPLLNLGGRYIRRISRRRG